ncbi:MAG: sigma-54 dependent transcriptional regulator [Myxococcota bacterium]
MTRVLVVDDHAASAESLAEALTELGYEADFATSGRQALAKLQEAPADVVVTDLRMEGMDGLALMAAIRDVDPHLPVILVTAYATIDRAVEATRSGAFAFLTKPLKVPELEVQVRNAATVRSLHARVDPDDGAIVGTSAALRSALVRADRAAVSDATVLVTGETGTGKELLARRIHARSPRAGKALVSLNAAALPDTLLEAELFGHTKGAFTGATADRAGLFEAAHEGTLFLDEIGELSPSAQTRLLRVLQEGTLRRVGENRDRTVDVRVIAATHRDLANDPTFRKDLFFRLNVIPIALPPLRARGEDIPLLFGHALRAACARAKRDVPTVTAEVVEVLRSHAWPGNVRELVNLAEQVAVLSIGDRVTVDDLPLGPAVPRDDGLVLPEGDFDFTAWAEGVEERVLRRALERAGGVKSRAASSLGLERTGFNYKLKKYGIE